MTVRRFQLSAALALGALLGSLAAAPAAAAAPALGEFEAAFAHVNDYTMRVRAHEVSGSATQDRVYQYWFKKPNFAKTEIVSGANAGSGGVWRGGSQVRGHLKIGFMTFHQSVDLHNPKATSLRGYTIPDGLLNREVEKYRDIKGEVTQKAGPAIDGQSTDEVTLNVADPAANQGVTRMVLFLSKTTHFPVKQQRFEGGKVVAEEAFADIKTNVELSDSDFPF